MLNIWPSFERKCEILHLTMRTRCCIIGTSDASHTFDTSRTNLTMYLVQGYRVHSKISKACFTVNPGYLVSLI